MRIYRHTVWLGAALVAGTLGCVPTDTKDGGTGEPQGFAMVFSATDRDPRDCIFEATDPGSSRDVVAATHLRLNVPDGEGPPNSLNVQYGGVALTGEVPLFPPPANATLVSPAAAGEPWSVTIGFGEDTIRELSGGQNWEITFSCGALPECCDETSRVDVTVNPT